MDTETFQYIVVGAGVCGGAAIQGIREQDRDGSILLIGNEEYLPYDRPPLSKGLWLGKKQVPDIFIHPTEYYRENNVAVAMNTEVTELQPSQQTIVDNHGHTYRYSTLLLATGGTPRRLDIPGADLPGVCYYRYLDDYYAIRDSVKDGSSVAVIGGGFIGSEIAASLCQNKLQVSMIFPDETLVTRVFPRDLGQALQQIFRQRGISVTAGDVPSAITQDGKRFIVQTKNGAQLAADVVIVGVGITPNVHLARAADLNVENGIVVNEYLQTSDPRIYAAGDNAYFPYSVLGQMMRVEHWDNAVNQGLYAGHNMAGAQQRYDYMPYFFSDLFEFGYEAVGQVSTKLETFADWQSTFETGVIYYLQDGKVRGAMMCNVWNKVEDARELIRSDRQWKPEQLRGRIGQEKAA